MKIYFIFSVKEEIYELYKDYPKALYNIFLEIYEMNKQDLEYGYSLFKQVAKSINKTDLDNQICNDLKDKLRYSKNNDEHIINNLYNKEVSLMKIKTTHITINTIHEYTEFFELLHKHEPFLFACNFKNDDYFFLSRIKTLV